MIGLSTVKPPFMASCTPTMMTSVRCQPSAPASAAAIAPLPVESGVASPVTRAGRGGRWSARPLRQRAEELDFVRPGGTGCMLWFGV